MADGDTDGYDIEEVRTEGYVAVVPSRHPLADRSSVALAELAGEAWIDNDHARGPCREIVLTACRELGFAPPFRIQAPDYTSALDYVAQAVGITVLPRLGALALPEGVADAGGRGCRGTTSHHAAGEALDAHAPRGRAHRRTAARGRRSLTVATNEGPPPAAGGLR